MTTTQDGGVARDATGNGPFWLRVARHEMGKFRSRNRPFYRVFRLPHTLEHELLRLDFDTPDDHHGRCPFRKMQAMAGLIVQHGLKSSVEIGVYRGSSLLPQAMAMRLTGGEAIGIDPWSMAEWRQEQGIHENDGPASKEYDANVAKIDWEALYREVQDKISRNGLENHCRLVRGLSFKVAGDIESGIGMLHIDGNHDADSVERDLRDYLPKLKRGGFLVMDDITWQGVAPHYRALRQTMPVIWETLTWAVLRKT